MNKDTNLLWFFEMYAYKLRASPCVRIWEGKYKVNNLAFELFDKVSGKWRHFSLHRSSEKYYKVVDYHNDVVNVFSTCHEVYKYIQSKQKEFHIYEN